MSYLDKDPRATGVEPETLSVVTPEAVKARIDDFLGDVETDIDGIFTPDAIRTVAVNSTSDSDNDGRYPQLDGDGDIELFSRGELSLREATAVVNGIEFARRITPAKPIHFYEKRFHSHEIISSGMVTAIHELYGIYDTPDSWHASPHSSSVAIAVLDFDDGSSRVFFPHAVSSYTLPDGEKIQMARDLGVKV